MLNIVNLAYLKDKTNLDRGMILILCGEEGADFKRDYILGKQALNYECKWCISFFVYSMFQQSHLKDH